jgi:kexin
MDSGGILLGLIMKIIIKCSPTGSSLLAVVILISTMMGNSLVSSSSLIAGPPVDSVRIEPQSQELDHHRVTKTPYKWTEFLQTHNSPTVDKDYDNRIYFAVELHPHVDVERFGDMFTAHPHSWRFEQPLGTLANHYVFSISRNSPHVDNIRATEQLVENHVYRRQLIKQGVKYLQIAEPHRLEKRLPVSKPSAKLAYGQVDSAYEIVAEVQQTLNISDPMFPQQWHLVNPLQPGHDLNITGVWYQGITGKGVAVAVVDDGLDMDHDDLKANYFAAGSWDFNDNGPDPRPRLSDDRHGTRCCGEIAAVRNDACGIGVAYEAKIAGIRILSKQISEVDEALSLNYAMDKNDIYSCSWGPPDDGQAMAEPGILVKKALLNGVQNGRDTKGSVFVFASGNGAGFGDNCNFDGYTNSIYSITVAAIDRQGLHPFYSEACSANMVVTYSSGSNDHIYTTDVQGACTNQHGGTSAAAPIAAGVFALVLSVRPDLTWRDLQYLAVDTAVPVNPDEPGWQKTFIGKKFHHLYGYGKLDAYAIVERAKDWQLVKPQAWVFMPKQTVNRMIEYSADSKQRGVKSTVSVTARDLKAANVARVEHVNVLINMQHQHRGVLTVELTSPAGVVSQLAAPRYLDTSAEGFVDWTFMSVVHWGESGVGDWTLHVYNDKKAVVSGQFFDWTLKLWGESIDGNKAKPFSYEPIQDGDDKVPVSSDTTSMVVPLPTATPPPPASIAPSRPTVNPAPIASPTGATTSGESKQSSSIWSLVPTFGLSHRTLAWVYGSLLLIVGFISGITAYICISRRRQRSQFKRRPITSSYEFDLIPSAADAADDESFHDEEELGVLSPVVTDDDDDDDDDTTALTKRTDMLSRQPSAGRQVRNLYDSYAQKEDTEGRELFRVDTDDDSDGRDEDTFVQGSSSHESGSDHGDKDRRNRG